MKTVLPILFVLVLCLGQISSVPSRDRNDKPFRVVCYWGTWAFYRPGDGKFQAEDIDPKLCTHLIYAFAKLENNRIAVFDPNLDIGDTDWQKSNVWGHGMYRRFNELRDKNPHLSTLIGIGGWNEGSDKYSAMARDPKARKDFVKSVISFLREHNFDGLALLITASIREYPGTRASGGVDRQPGRAEDKGDFIALIKELREAFKPYGYILTAAVSAGKPTIDRAYDVPKLNKYLDFINLMTYDFHGAWEKVTGHNAPLNPLVGSSQQDSEFTVSYAVDYWLKLGADPQKLVMGIPLYGRTFTLANAQSNEIGAAAVGNGGTVGPFTRQVGTLGYNEICSLLKKEHWTERFSSVQQVSYATRGNQWIGYDNLKSVEKKMDLVVSRKLGGAMVWSLETDDFKGLCGEGKYPLLRSIVKTFHNAKSSVPDAQLNNSAKLSPTTTTTTTTTSTTIVTVNPSTSSTRPQGKKKKKFTCKSQGILPYRKSAAKFHVCLKIDGEMRHYKHKCTQDKATCRKELKRFFEIFRNLIHE